MKYTVQAVILNKDGMVLGVSRKDNHFDFGLPGGKVEDQDYDFDCNGFESALHSACFREVKEETGLLVVMSTAEMVFAMHKDGYMSYTFYIKEWSGEINYDEPHVVDWKPFEVLIHGSFGFYNKMVKESLQDMGVSLIVKIPIEPLKKELNEYLLNIQSSIVIGDIRPTEFGGGSLELHPEQGNRYGDRYVCELTQENKIQLDTICQKYGFKGGRFPYYYYPK